MRHRFDPTHGHGSSSSPTAVLTRLALAGMACAALSQTALATGNVCSLTYVENPGPPGGRLVSIDQSALATSTFCGGTAGYSNEIWVDQPDPVLIGVGHETPNGSTVDLGYFSAGSELVFFIYVRNTGDYFYSGPASRNPDGLVHAAVDKVGENLWRVGFEDAFGATELDYQDVNIVVSAGAEVYVDTDGDGIDEVVRFDTDQDGLTDDLDACPYEDARGYSATDGCIPDSDGDGVKDNRDLCPDLDDLADADDDGVRDCFEISSGTRVTATGSVSGWCFSWTTYETLETTHALEVVVTYPDGLAPFGTGSYLGDGEDHNVYAYFGGAAIKQTVQLDGLPLASLTHGLLTVRDYHWYGLDNDSFGDAVNTSDYTREIGWTLYGGQVFDSVDALPNDITLSDFDGGSFYYYEYSNELECELYGSMSSFLVTRVFPDSDADGRYDYLDLCPGHDDTIDTDQDGLPDGCDACPVNAENDADVDGICEVNDNCPAVPNSNQSNVDHDAWGDVCEPDADGDGVSDDYDNCYMVANPSQADADHDGTGDLCEADTDHDGVIDDGDLCAGTPSGTLTDVTGCSIDQLAPCNGSWKNHGAYVSAVAKAANAFVAAGLISEATKDATVSAAAGSSCGNKR